MTSSFFVAVFHVSTATIVTARRMQTNFLLFPTKSSNVRPCKNEEIMENMKIEFAFAYTQKIENTIEGGKK